eukprot:SRR837773.8125.p1 GENE.SRR837773.8125~~SRR837773.8125.p1  ORF type:complete len:613 (-),score=100.59 SRR837773.8125:204-1847(-)
MSPPGKGRRICATVGASGMGKSALLETFAIAQNKIVGRRALFVTYNTQKPVPTLFWDANPTQREFCIAGALLHAAGVAKEQLLQLARATTASQAVAVIRRQLGMADDHVLVVCIDELLQVRDSKTIAMFVSGYMLLQDEQKGKLVVVFSAFAENQVEGWISQSGRQLFPIFLGPLLHAEAKSVLLKEVASSPGNLATWLQEDFADKVVRVVATHPRSLFDFLPGQVECSPQQQSVPGLVTSVFAQTPRFGELICSARSRFEELLQDRFKEYSDDVLIQLGLQIEDPKTHERLLVPFLTRALAYSQAQPSPVCQLLRSALDADLLVTKETRVRAEGVVQSFEGMMRLVHGHGRLDQLFFGAKVGSSLKDNVYSFLPANRPADLLTRVDGFGTSSDALLKRLRSGQVVVSRKSNEPGIEHMSPLFDNDGTMVALLVTQIKAGTSPPALYYKNGQRVPPTKVCAELCRRATIVGTKVIGEATDIIDVIPVVMINSACPLSGSRKAVQLGHDELALWLHPLMPLQMIEEAEEVDTGDSLSHDPDPGDAEAV